MYLNHIFPIYLLKSRCACAVLCVCSVGRGSSSNNGDNCNTAANDAMRRHSHSGAAANQQSFRCKKG